MATLVRWRWDNAISAACNVRPWSRYRDVDDIIAELSLRRGANRRVAMEIQFGVTDGSFMDLRMFRYRNPSVAIQNLPGAAGKIRACVGLDSSWDGIFLIWDRVLGPNPDESRFVLASKGLRVIPGPGWTEDEDGSLPDQEGGEVVEQLQGDSKPVGFWHVRWDCGGHAVGPKMRAFAGGRSAHACGAMGRYALALEPEPLLLTLHLAILPGPEGLLAVSCTTMGGDEVASLSLDPQRPLRELRAMVAAAAGEHAARIKFLLPAGTVIGDLSRDEPVGKLLGVVRVTEPEKEEEEEEKEEYDCAPGPASLSDRLGLVSYRS